MNLHREFPRVIFAGAIFVILTGCGGGGSSNTTPPKPTTIVTINARTEDLDNPTPDGLYSNYTYMANDNMMLEVDTLLSTENGTTAPGYFTSVEFYRYGETGEPIAWDGQTSTHLVENYTIPVRSDVTAEQTYSSVVVANYIDANDNNTPKTWTVTLVPPINVLPAQNFAYSPSVLNSAQKIHDLSVILAQGLDLVNGGTNSVQDWEDYLTINISTFNSLGDDFIDKAFYINKSNSVSGSDYNSMPNPHYYLWQIKNLLDIP